MASALSIPAKSRVARWRRRIWLASSVISATGSTQFGMTERLGARSGELEEVAA